MKRDNKGQFTVTTGSTKRKAVQYHGYRMSRYNREFCVLLGIDRLPKELMVHHIDGNTLNDNIDNLALMTYTAHNRIHAPERQIWNKGLTTETSDKWRATMEKVQERRERTFMKRFEKTQKLKEQGLKLREIADRLGISRRQVSERLVRYRELNEKYGN